MNQSLNDDLRNTQKALNTYYQYVIGLASELYLMNRELEIFTNDFFSEDTLIQVLQAAHRKLKDYPYKKVTFQCTESEDEIYDIEDTKKQLEFILILRGKISVNKENNVCETCSLFKNGCNEIDISKGTEYLENEKNGNVYYCLMYQQKKTKRDSIQRFKKAKKTK